MLNENESVTQTEPRKLQKPARETEELNREQLVAYTDESGGPNPGDPGGGDKPT